MKENSKLWSGYLSEIKRCLTAQSNALQNRVDWIAMNQERDFDTRISQTNEQIQALANQVGMVQMQLALVFKQLRHGQEQTPSREAESGGRKRSPPGHSRSLGRRRSRIVESDDTDEDADLARAVQKIVKKALEEQKSAAEPGSEQ